MLKVNALTYYWKVVKFPDYESITTFCDNAYEQLSKNEKCYFIVDTKDVKTRSNAETKEYLKQFIKKVDNIKYVYVISGRNKLINTSTNMTLKILYKKNFRMVNELSEALDHINSIEKNTELNSLK
ncbi:MAG: hypothetical protein OEY49_06240 [Candidatus Heimdallarchaeota archaeon]|nr:hypothetical protein [Candidatus Heimdallarchaeota archaeon]